MKKLVKKLFVLPLLGLLTFALGSCAQPQSVAVNDPIIEEKLPSFEINKSVQEWRTSLTAEQFSVLRNKGTEPAFTGKFLHNEKSGDYTCAACDNVLFKSDAKFDSHSGWPSFDKAVEGGKVKSILDNSHGMERTEVVCGRCGGHLDHLFEDGPTKTGLRYCINSRSLDFKENQ